MFTFDILLDLSKTGYQAEIAEHLESLISCLYDSRQITNGDCTVVHAANTLRVSVTCPEMDALDAKNSTAYGKHRLEKIEEVLQMPVQFIPTGNDPRYLPYSDQEKPSFYVLYFAGYSPLIHGDSGDLIPLYKIPFTYHDEACYNDILFWSNNYERIYGLWFNGAVGEQFARRQMQDPNSALSRQGRAVCQRIEELTGVPTYYFLFNYRRRTRQQDLDWKCPLCGKAWLIEGAAPSDFIAFRCAESRLVSGFTKNS